MATSSSFPDVFSWLCNLPPFHQWNTSSIDLYRPSSPSSSSSQPSLNLSIKNINNSHFTLSILAEYNLPVILWTSKKVTPKPMSQKLLDDGNNIATTLLSYFIEDVLKHTLHKGNNSNSSSLKLIVPPSNQDDDLKDMFNFSFLSLTLVVCVYEAPSDLRGACLGTLVDQFACPKSRQVSKNLMRLVGNNVEEQWMRSMNLAITNWLSENAALRTPSPMFSHSFSTVGLWKVQLYCPVIAMDMEKSSSPSPDDRLSMSINYHQVEGVIQLNYQVDIQEKWIEVMVNIDNIRCDVVKLLTDAQMKDRGAGPSEKHFPSRISLQITPALQASVISVSVSKSTQNPAREFGVEKGIEASFEPPSAIGLHLSAAESVTTSLKPWKFEQSVHGNTAHLNWFLHDAGDGREVFSSKPSKLALLHPKSWFKHRYSRVGRPFTRQGGVVFAGDEYGERVRWRVDPGCCAGKSMEWEINGWIWVTYWPNKHRTFYTETRRLQFREILILNLD